MSLVESQIASELVEHRYQLHLGTLYTPIDTLIAALQRHLDYEHNNRATISALHATIADLHAQIAAQVAA